MAGGVTRPSSDISVASVTQDENGSTIRKDVVVNSQPGDSPVAAARVNISRGQNPQMDSLIEALESDTHPERLTPSAAATPFDATQWKANPGLYLSVVEPGRIYDTMASDPNVKVLAGLSPGYSTAVVGEAVRLQVRTEPNSPVTYTNFLNGYFENGLRSITVVSDADGIAEAISTMPVGDLATRAEIVVGSPVTSGTASFVLEAAPRSK